MTLVSMKHVFKEYMERVTLAIVTLKYHVFRDELYIVLSYLL